MPKTILDGYMSITDAAHELDKSEQTIYNWIERDKISCLKVGGKSFISEKEVARLKKDHESKP